MRNRQLLFLIPILGLLAAIVTASASLAAPAPKVDVCHKRGNGSYGPLSINTNALPAHLEHGDVLQPNGLVPGNPGFVFDSECDVQSWDYAVNVPPDPSAEDPSSPGTLFVGAGIPAENFGTARNEDVGIELGLMVLYRQGPTVPSTDDYADGVLHVAVNAGPQSTSNGSFVDNPARAAWNFTFSVVTGLNGATTDLNDYQFQLLYDVDPSPGTTYRSLTLEPGGTGSSGFQWRDQGTALIFINDDEGNTNVTQNSENYAFGFFQGFLTSPYGPGNGFAGPAQFDIILQAFEGAQLIVRNHIVVDVGS
jgi:hypothetical protein